MRHAARQLPSWLIFDVRQRVPPPMGNPISNQLTLGTIAELLVQASLLQFDVQAAPPLKDSGNDLIAIRRAAIRDPKGEVVAYFSEDFQRFPDVTKNA